MTGGELQLASYGAQDQYLTGNPQISFFKMVYRRYTNFSMESIKCTFDGNTNLLLSSNITFRAKIQRIGDLLSTMYFCFNLPEIYSGTRNNINYEFQWIKNIGTNIIDNVRILLGGNILDSHYGEWLNIWNELTLSNDELTAFNKLIGNIPELYDPKNSNGSLNSEGIPIYPTNSIDSNIPSIEKQIIYVPFAFWFNKNPGLALPLIALQYMDLEVYIDIKPIYDLYTIIETDTNTTNSGKRIKPTSEHHNIGYFFKSNKFVNDLDIIPFMELNYIFLDEKERTRFSGVEHQYLIETTRKIHSTGHTNFANIKLELQHPTKKIIWVGKRNDADERNDWNNYTNWIYEDIPPFRTENYQTIYNYGKNYNNEYFYPDPNDSSQNWQNYTYLKKDIINNAKLILNGMDRFDYKDNKYFQYAQPLQHFKKSFNKDGIFLYSFSLNPEKHQPSGSCNMSRINKISIQFEINNPPIKSNINPEDDPTNNYYYQYDFNIYSVTYNIFRIMSGIGGLEFAN